ncbi:MAG: MOSC domain-containing protein [Acidobacteria bacterium]|nr:MAG: MOSC domain-containing protein [Acidobacteriota bacterium]
MSDATQTEAGAVVSLWRYPVKSMIGEELASVALSERGLAGDRAWALQDSTDGKMATAKNPRKWPNLFAFHASCPASPAGSAAAAVRITLPNGSVLTDQTSNVNRILSQTLGREVTLVSTERLGSGSRAAQDSTAHSEEYWPDIEGLDHRETVTDFALPAGTFFDCATVHLLTTTTLGRLRSLYPQGRFELPRFRPNIVVRPAGDELTFVEDSWIGQTIAIGEDVRLRITGPCGRCVMTTLAQGDLPNDTGILRTAVQHNRANVGVYAAVVRGGTIHRGDRVVVSGE